MARNRKASPSHPQTKTKASSSRSRPGRNSSPTRSVDGVAVPKSKISYEKNGRTDGIIDWLTENVSDRVRLFSDNVRDEEGRTVPKMIIYRKIAAAIFENDQEEKDNFAKDPEKYAKSVENHIRGYGDLYIILWREFKLLDF